VSEHDRDLPDLIDRVARTLREPVATDGALDARIMARVLAAPAPAAGGAWWRWLRRPALSPLGAIGLAAILAGVLLAPRVRRTPAARPTLSEVQFVFVAPRASSVSVVGDFNDWNLAATPLARAGAAGVWSVSVPLEPGRYTYAFVVDGRRWAADPDAPRAAGDDFGTPNSVVLVRGAS